MRGIKTKVTMERTLYVDLPDDATEAEVLEAANKEIILPTNALCTASQALRNLHVDIPTLCCLLIGNMTCLFFPLLNILYYLYYCCEKIICIITK